MDREEIEDMIETMLIGDSDQRELRRLLIEYGQEIQHLRDENERLKTLADSGKNRVDTKQKCVIDMTRPQPCVKAKEQTDAELAMKLAEEVQEVTAAMKAFDCATRENAYCRYAPRLARDRLGEELTDVITVCVTWLASLGDDEAERGRIQRAVNEKNRKRGYWR